MVTVIIPNYNHALYLQQRLESVLNQTWQDFEIIILDDCSTDNSREIIEKYRDHQKVTSILYNDINSGNTFTQWVKGIEISHREFVWIAESDDWCEPSFLENILNGMMRDLQCVVGFCQSFCVQDSNVVKWKSSYPYLSNYIEGKEFVKRFMLQDNTIFNASMVVWRRASFKYVTNEFTKYKYCGDWLFWIELCRLGNVYISGKFLNYFRMHDMNISAKANRLGDNFIEELKMFHLLYKSKWIDYDDLLKSLQKEYVHYKAVATTFCLNKRKKIETLFFAEHGTRAFLKYYYRAFYFKYAINKILSRLLLIDFGIQGG